MKTGFMDAAGVDPTRMKTVIAVLVICVILLVGAWIAKQVLEAYGQGSLDNNEVFKTIVSLAIVILMAIGFVSFF